MPKLLSLNSNERKLQLIILVMLVPLVPWQLGGRQPVAMLVSLIAIALALFLQWGRERIASSSHVNLPWPLVAFVAWGALSLVWSINRYQTITWLLVVVLGWAAYSSARSIGRDKRLVRWWINGYLALATIYSLYGLFIYLTDSYERLTSSFYLANAFAIYALPAAILAAWSYVHFKRWYHLVAASVCLGSLILADSRTVFILLGLVALVLAVSKYKMGQWLRVGLVMVCAVALVLVANGGRRVLFHHQTAVAGARFSQVANGEATNGSDRIYYLKSTWLIWKSHPIAGTGAGTFASIHPQYQLRVVSASLNAHNFYAQTVAELGLVGIVLLMLVVLLVLRLAYASWKQKRYRLLAVIVVVMLIHFGLDIDAVYPPIVGVFAFLVGYLSVGVETQKNNKIVQKPSPTLIVLIVVIVGCVLAGAIYQSDRNRSLAQVSQDNGDYQAAAQSFAAVTSWRIYDPDVLTADGINLYALAATESNQNQAKAALAQAQRLAQQAHKIDPYDAQHEFLLGRVLLKENDVAAAEAAYKTTITMDPYNHPEYYLDLAKLYLATDRSGQAVTTATTILKQYPSSVIANRGFIPGLASALSNLYYVRAVAEGLQGQAGGAVQGDLKSAISLDATNLAAQSLLVQYGALGQ